MPQLAIGAQPRGDFEAALQSDSPYAALKAAVTGLLRSGVDSDDVLRLLDEFHERLDSAHRGDDAEVVLDVMDALVGWVAPQDWIQAARL